MTERLAIVVALVVLGGAIAALLAQLRRRRSSRLPDRIALEPLGLELMSGCCAFVVFTTAACRPCKAALRVVRAAAAGARGTDVRVIDAIADAPLALRYRVRTVPTIFLVTASGHVLGRWTGVPGDEELRAALARPEFEPVDQSSRTRLAAGRR